MNGRRRPAPRRGRLAGPIATLAVAFLLEALSPAAVLAQAPPPAQRELPALSGFSVVPFDFGPPGARSLGMGGTFLALADDATASEANPAGLTQLSRPEISIHVRHSETEIETLDINAFTALEQLNRERTFSSRLVPGSALGNAFAGSTRVGFEPEVDEVSFASYVHPYDGYAFSVYYQRSTDFSGGHVFEAFDDSVLDYYRATQALDVVLENVGISAAFEAGDQLSVGFSIRYSALDARAVQDLRIDYSADIELGALAPGASLAEVRSLGILDQRVQREEYDDQGRDVTFNAGLLWKPHDRVSIGLVYKDGARFRVEGVALDFGCLDPMPDPGTPCEPGAFVTTGERFEVPDFLGIGIAWRVTDRLELALDLDAIEYSGINPVLTPQDIPAVRQQVEEIDDVVEVHFGIEKIFLLGRRNVPLTVRAGVYTNPDHDGIVGIDSDETVYTFGLGTVFMERVQLDLAARSSDRSEAGIVSMVYRF